MKKKFTYQHTIYVCFIAYIIQAIVNNFAPLLFVLFQEDYGISLTQTTLLITLNFGVQLLVDLSSAVFIDRIGYRKCGIIAHACSFLGLGMLAVLPNVMGNSFAGLIIAVIIYAIGGGLIEVMISPIVEACPTDNKETVMSLLHSFYCWGTVGVILLSTIFFAIFGIKNWVFMAWIFALIPLINMILFSQVPLYHLVEEEKKVPVLSLFKNKVFWLLLIMMACGGASEQGVSQWASSYSEASLGVSKTVGDIAGPMFFALCMGTSRATYGKIGKKISLIKFMFISGIVCVVGYLMIALSPIPLIGLLGCGVCGFAVGIFWPGATSIASMNLRKGGTAVFAFLALAGDLGCSGGPTIIGFVAEHYNNDLGKGLMVGILFPILILIGLSLLRKENRAKYE